ncbi:MAG: NAD(P)-dependent alcohol dehydrogenase [Bacteroidetes bacterium]|nr:NAD(P)-dependent alcohol dehydrogenase [Bacteroidota bacterium]MBU1679428.1 NAD(P)-dependent alcohol dehydrogenase [Bacteroidota bacterium]
MKAVYILNYGGVEQFKIGELPISKPAKNEVLIEVYASSVNPVDFKVRSGMAKFLSGNKFPKILGTDISGVVVETGREVAKFKVGDAVFGAASVVFGRNGGNAEFAAVPEKNLSVKPEDLSFEEAACIPVAGTTAYHNLRNTNIQSGDKVLVNGASGGVGIFALQIAIIFGAEVTAVCSAKNIDFAKSLGADKVVDYTHENFLKNGMKYNFVFDAYGKLAFQDVINSLEENGVMFSTLPTPGILFQSLKTKLFGSKRALMANANYSANNLSEIAELVIQGKIKIHIDKVFPLEKLADAHMQLEQGGGKGKLVVVNKN